MTQNPTCFLIDDDDDDRDFLVEALAEIDSTLTCIRARNGAEGVTMLSSGEIVPNFILLDLNMPVMSGTDCLARLRRFPHLAATPIHIYTTAACSHIFISKMIDAGASSVFTKPIRLADLVRLVRALVNQIAVTRNRTIL